MRTPWQLPGLAFLAAGALLVMLTAPVAFASSAAGTVTGPPPIVVLGFAGADAGMVEFWLAQGALPNLARLRDQGGWTPLLPSAPPEALVSWQALTTGIVPGDGRVIREVRRAPDSYEVRPGFFETERVRLLWGKRDPLVLGLALATLVGGLLAWSLWSVHIRLRWALQAGLVALLVLAAPAWVVFARLLPRERQRLVAAPQAAAVWDRFAVAGRSTTVVHVPGTFPARPLRGGRLLAGPPFALAGDGGSEPVLYTTHGGGDAVVGQAGALRMLTLASNGAAETTVEGPPDPVSPGSRLSVPLRLVPDATDRSVSIELGRQTWRLRAGEWSHWIPVAFPVNALLDRLTPVERLARFRLLSVEPEVEVYLAPLAAPPGQQAASIGEPQEWARRVGHRFETLPDGPDLDLLYFPSSDSDIELVVRAILAAQERRAALMEALLDGPRDALHFQVFDGPERAGHLLWPEAPPVGAAGSNTAGHEALRRVYVQMDRIVGRAMRRLPADALLVVCSAHGMAPVGRLFDVDAWLAREDYVVRHAPGRADQGTTQRPPAVDWAATLAYADGPAAITFNVEGRQGRGSVVAEGLPGRLDGIRRRLLAWVDPATGRRPLAAVLAGPSDGGPDLLLIMKGGYGAEPRPPGPRALVGRPVTRQAPAAWSGGHVAQASDRVAGILFVNRPLVAGRPRVIDVTPTLMVAAGLPLPPTLGGRPLLAEQQGTR